MTTTHSADVLIVGAGPTGTTLALLLANDNVRSCLIDQNPGPQQHPAACILNTRTMEIFRELGIADMIMHQGQDVKQRSQITWVTSLAGRQLGSLNAAHDLDQALLASPLHAMHFPQNRLEPMLWDMAERHPLITVMRDRRLVGLESHEHHATADVCDRNTGQITRLSGKWLVGCDGAASTTRRLAAVTWEADVIQPMMSVHFLADLSNFVEYRPSILYWIFNPGLLGVLIAHWLPTEWVLMTPFFPPHESREDFSEPRCRRLVAAAIGERDVPCTIQHVGNWALSAGMAASFRVGRIFLAGDAAHTFPPTGGLGLNTGVQDAHNLAWKLSLEIKGIAATELLDTYPAERRPVAQANLRHSVSNFEKMDRLLQPAGLRMSSLRRLARAQRSTLFQALPATWQRTFVTTAVRCGLRRLKRFEAPGATGQRARRKFLNNLPGQKPHYCSLGLDLGFTYRSGAIVSELEKCPQAADPVMDYRPTTWPGARLPHCWLEHDGKRVSTLDLLHPRLPVLFVAGAAARPWIQTVSQLRKLLELPISCVCVTDQQSARTLSAESTRYVEDRDGSWATAREVAVDGALLVRPDGHVAWRTMHMPEDPVNELLKALTQIIHLQAVAPT